jgi:hypothetical protein
MVKFVAVVVVLMEIAVLAKIAVIVFINAVNKNIVVEAHFCGCI